jgi:sugar phosphate isomerase/epimerase
MPIHTRRQFLQSGAASLACSSTLLNSTKLPASPLALPLGLQLYSVREMLPADFAGTLQKLGALGYREVEAAGFFGHSAQDVKQAMSDAGLRCVSAHYAWPELSRDLDKIIEFHHQISADYIICSFPGFKDPSRLKDHSYSGQVRSFTIEDWRWNAEQFNGVGATIKAAGLEFGYHNHTMEFAAQDGIVPFDELLRLTDPALVTIEMDCGWVTVGGGDPVGYLHRYPRRISMLHVKDFKPSDKPTGPANPPVAAEMGRGTIDFHALFKAAKKGRIKHCFVEQEEYDMPPFEALKVDAIYMKSLTI